MSDDVQLTPERLAQIRSDWSRHDWINYIQSDAVEDILALLDAYDALARQLEIIQQVNMPAMIAERDQLAREVEALKVQLMADATQGQQLDDAMTAVRILRRQLADLHVKLAEARQQVNGAIHDRMIWENECKRAQQRLAELEVKLASQT